MKPLAAYFKNLKAPLDAYSERQLDEMDRYQKPKCNLMRRFLACLAVDVMLVLADCHTGPTGKRLDPRPRCDPAPRGRGDERDAVKNQRQGGRWRQHGRPVQRRVAVLNYRADSPGRSR